ncbi:MAG: Sortase family enzyme [Candidatus Saccharibacteria bacterium]|nr:Sortase family enzyme [Candidatus Saccharibacteria bacterium]
MASGLYIQQKRDYHFGRWLLVIIFIILLSLAGWYGYKWFTTGDVPPIVPLPAAALADPSVDETKVTTTQIDSYTVPATHPRYISIPALGVIKARVQTVGLTKNNTLDTPKNISDTAWYNKSGIPGSGYGAVVIDGHNGGISRDGIFANLNKLKSGDEITIERGDGKKITYSVAENKTESLQDANTTGMQRIMTPYGSSQEGLGLITCAGNWVPRDKVFDKRVLVRAVVKS